MNKKTVILVIILSILIGIGIFFIDKFLNRDTGLVKSTSNLTDVLKKPSPTPTPKPTLPPLTPESNLSKEIDNLIPSDYSEEFKKIKEEASL